LAASQTTINGGSGASRTANDSRSVAFASAINQSAAFALPASRSSIFKTALKALVLSMALSLPVMAQDEAGDAVSTNEALTTTGEMDTRLRGYDREGRGNDGIGEALKYAQNEKAAIAHHDQDANQTTEAATSESAQTVQNDVNRSLSDEKQALSESGEVETLNEIVVTDVAGGGVELLQTL
jgi:hypothetical protein